MAIRIVLTYIPLKSTRLKNCIVRPPDPISIIRPGKLTALYFLEENLSKIFFYRLDPEMTTSFLETSKIYYNYVYD